MSRERVRPGDFDRRVRHEERVTSQRDRMLAVFVAQGSALAGETLTPETLLERLKDPAFRARFNAGSPDVVRYPDAETARLASAFESAAILQPPPKR